MIAGLLTMRERLHGATLVLFDGTLWSDDEMITAGLGPKTGARMGHTSVFGSGGTMAGFEALGVERWVLIHINNPTRCCSRIPTNARLRRQPGGSVAGLDSAGRVRAVSRMTVPRFNRGFRLRHDTVLDSWGVFALDDHTAEVLKSVDGHGTLEEIIVSLSQKYQAPAAEIADDVRSMLEDLVTKGATQL